MYRVIEVPPGSAQTAEPLGTKYKFWFRHPSHGLTLFKEGRPGTGENWAEKIACELAGLLFMPHARYELAMYEGRQGVVSTSLVDRNARIVHGNELLAEFSTAYTRDAPPRYRDARHTLRRVVAYFKANSDSLRAPYGWARTERVQTPLDFFIGYLMFDAWIGNQDRHDQNWGTLQMNDGNMFLSPSYDHGSSMARNEPDAKRLLRLNTKDRLQHISTFATKARSGLFPTTNETAPPPLLTLDAFLQAATFSEHAAAEWRERLQAITPERVRSTIDEVPVEWMTPVARDFTAELLRINRERILNFKPT